MSNTIIVVTGSLVARPECLPALLAASLEHVHRSRTEAGCLSHGVSIDAEDPLRLIFVERWSDLAALEYHLRQQGSLTFMSAIREYAVRSEGMQVYVAQATDI